MNAGTRAILLGLVALAWDSAAPGAAITYSTSGTIAVSNEPDPALRGVVGGSLAGAGDLDLGSIAITPIVPFTADEAAPPALDGAPFDIRVAFGGGAPTIDIKGTIHQSPADDYAYIGRATSVTSSAPALDAALPSRFADALSDPSDLTIRVGMWDWGISSLPVTASFRPVPEPSTLAVVAAAGAVLALRHRRSAGR